MLKLAAVDYTQCKTSPRRAACCCCCCCGEMPAGRRFHLTGVNMSTAVSQQHPPPPSHPPDCQLQTFNSQRLNHSRRPRGNGWMAARAPVSPSCSAGILPPWPTQLDRRGAWLRWQTPAAATPPCTAFRFSEEEEGGRFFSSDGRASCQALAGQSEEE